MTDTKRNRVPILGLGALCTTVGIYAACGDDSSNGATPLNPDGGSLDGTTTKDGTTGQDANAGDTSASDVVSADVAVDAGPWCGADRDGGALCPPHEWRDFGPPDAGDAATCKACPTAPITCETALLRIIDGGLAFSMPQYDGGSNKMTLALPPGQLEVISVTNATAVMSSSCYGGPTASVTGPQTIPVSVEGDQLVFDFAGTDAGSGNGVGPCGTISFTVNDSCCTTSNVVVKAYWDLELHQLRNGTCDAGN
jgi:hypothetical protein